MARSQINLEAAIPALTEPFLTTTPLSDLTNLNNHGIVTANNSDETATFEFATYEQMDDATDAVLLFMKCREPFSVVCGGHSNAGASILSGSSLLSIRLLNGVEADFKEDLLLDKLSFVLYSCSTLP